MQTKKCLHLSLSSVALLTNLYCGNVRHRHIQKPIFVLGKRKLNSGILMFQYQQMFYRIAFYNFSYHEIAPHVSAFVRYAVHHHLERNVLWSCVAPGQLCFLQILEDANSVILIINESVTCRKRVLTVTLKHEWNNYTFALFWLSSNVTHKNMFETTIL